jgi:predicted AAA+ superfamily ATPase
LTGDTTMFQREMYLERIRPFYNNEQIKILSGVRRCGKTEILKMIMAELRKNCPESNIIYLSLELLENEDYQDKKNLYAYLESQIKDEGRYYIFIDEVQFCEGWSKVVNSLKTKYPNVSIFVTGSNSSLLNDDKEGELGGRTIPFRIMPFSFSEYVAFTKELGRYQSDEASFSEYLKWGGLPLVFLEKEEQNKETMLESLYDSIVLRDIVLRKKIKNSIYLDKVIDYALSSSSLAVSGRNIQERIAKDGMDISLPVVLDYLRAITESCIASLSPRYDVIGLRELEVNNKIYAVDPAFVQYKKPLVSDLYGSLYETLVYNDLIAKGYQVKTGVNEGKEIDFVALKGGNIVAYVQVAYEINEGNKEREFGNLESISDFYPKYVVSKDKIALDRKGIIHLSMTDFLQLKNL